jgi:hypothetical protein
MEERMRDDGFEATFVVSTSRAVAWERLTSAAPAMEGIGAAREGQWWIPGIEGPAEPIEVRDGALFWGRKAAQPCKNTEIVVRLEDAETGTRITIVQSGFGDGFATQRPWLAAGWYAILADLVAYFEHGVALGRHLRPWASIGCEVEETAAGLRVGKVDENGLAQSAGLEPGDLIVHIAGSPVLTVRDLAIVARGPLQRLGEAKLRWLRGDEVMSGTGRL